MQLREELGGYLQKIDLYFDDKSKNVFQMYCTVIVVCIFAFAYLFYYEDIYNNSLAVYDKNTQSALNLEKKTQEFGGYFGFEEIDEKKINEFTNQKIMNISMQTDKLKQDMVLIENTRYFFKKKLDELSYLLYSDIRGADFLKILTEEAKKYKLFISEIEYDSSYIENAKDKKVSPALDVSLKFYGDFKDIVRYINYIEKSKMVVDINGINLFKNYADENTKNNQDKNDGADNQNKAFAKNNNHINVIMKISIWGVN